MINFYKSAGSSIREVEEYEEGAWINLINPTEEEIYMASRFAEAELVFIKAALDDEETSRIETEEEQTLIIVDVPMADKEEDGTVVFSTLQLGVVMTKKGIITVALKETSVISDFKNGIIRGVDTRQKTRFLLLLMLRAANRYLFHLRQIEKASDRSEDELYKSQRNQEIMQLLNLEKSLVYFSASLKSSEATLEKLLRGRIIKLYDEDQELLEDVIIEFKQAIEMADIYTHTLNSTMDAYASIISNNMNQIMKVLTLMTIFMTIPTIIFSYYGMNVTNLPIANSIFPIFISLIAVGIIWLVLKKRGLY